MSMILPPLPKALQALATDRQPALSITEIISELRQSPQGGMAWQIAEALDRHQQYSDSNGNYVSLLVDYLDGLTKTANPVGGDLSGTLPDPTVIAIQGNAIDGTAPNNGDVLKWVTADSAWEPKPPASGTVTSVGVSLPGIFSVSGSPVTSAGTLTGTLATQSANRIFSGPTSGGAATPAFRALVTGDMPGISATVALAALTGGGTQGTAVFTNGVLTAYTPPT